MRTLLVFGGPKKVLEAALKSYLDYWSERIPNTDGVLEQCLADVNEEQLARIDGAAIPTVQLAQNLLAARGFPVRAWERDRAKIVWSRNSRGMLKPHPRT